MTTLAQDAAALGQARMYRDKAKIKYEDLKIRADELEAAFYARMEHEDVSGIKVGASNFVRAATSFGTVQDRSEFIKWAEEERPELLETKERKALVNEIVRECLDNGDTLPPGLGFYTREYVSQRAA